jgi:hypothetical protein
MQTFLWFINYSYYSLTISGVLVLLFDKYLPLNGGREQNQNQNQIKTYLDEFKYSTSLVKSLKEKQKNESQRPEHESHRPDLEK